MNNKIIQVFCFILILASLANQVFAQEKIADKTHEKAIKQGRQLITNLISEQKIPGLAIAVVVDDKFVWSEGFGIADLEHNIPVTPKTLFRVGSVSKLFTAAAVAKLFEQGLLDLDAPVQKYVPTFPKKEFEITSRELLGHLAGIRHYKRDDFINQQRFETVSDSLKKFQDDPLLHEPNSKYSYSSSGFVLLSAVIEGVSKQDYPAFMQTQVFNPLGLKNTVVDNNRKIIEDRTDFYSKDSDGIIQNAIYMDTSDRLAAGGFISTAEDLARFGLANLNGNFFKPETQKMTFTSQKTSDGKETGVGFGWRIGKDTKGRKIYHHGGDSIGGRAFLIIYPESKVIVAVTSNLSFVKFDEKEAEKIAELFTN